MHNGAVPRLPTEFRITASVSVPAHEVGLSYARSGGPGGQHVNKTATKVLLRWNLERSGAVTPAQRERMRDRLGPRLTEDGDLLVTSERHREQARNVEDAAAKFIAVLREALRIPRKRRATKPTRGSKTRRLDAKRRRGDTKRQRRKPGGDE